MSTATRTVEISNVGPIEELILPCPEEGGVVELTGTHGTGKSTALRAINRTAGGKDDVEVQDDCPRGTVNGFGVSLTIGKSTRVKGQCEVHTLEGRLSIADLVDPGMKSEDANDARRIKALVQLAGVRPDVSMFHALVGGQVEFEKLVGPDATKGDDLVAMADRIKRALEAKAREAEGQAEHASGHAQASREAADKCDVPEDAVTDSIKLQAALEQAIADKAKLDADRENAAKLIDAAELAKAAIEDAEAEANAVTVTEAQGRLDSAADRLKDADAELSRLRTAVYAAEQAKASAESAHQAATQALASAKQHEATLAAWRKQVADASAVAVPLPATLDSAEDRVTEAREAIERGVLARQAIEHRKAAEANDKLRDEHTAKAERLRQAAAGTDGVLSDAVARTGTKLRVHAGRLVIETDRSPREPYSELSDGERVKVALDIAIEAVGHGGMLTLGQPLWEGLSPATRREVAKQLVAAKVVAYTARVTDDAELKAEAY